MENQPQPASPPKLLANVIRQSGPPRNSTTFDPQKLEDIGFAGFSGSLPAISFSGEENEKLAKSLGHSIVGKFSHSIPTGQQIQKALDNIKFMRHFSWRYINAKHVLIQFDDLTDYAKMINGPKGTPVWYVDRHPMRVFKWTPHFDVFFETPIAAIWCNLIALPIHLYDSSALFAIGKLFGNPIQIDQATANRTRYSYARICIEIDITDHPPEEFVFDIGGKEVIQKIKWDKIPLFCTDCHHVGHLKEACYAFGKKEKPDKRDYSHPQGSHRQNPINGNHGRHQQHGKQGNKKDEGNRHSSPSKATRSSAGKSLEHGKENKGNAGASSASDNASALPDILGAPDSSGALIINPLDHGHWEVQTGSARPPLFQRHSRPQASLPSYGNSSVYGSERRTGSSSPPRRGSNGRGSSGFTRGGVSGGRYSNIMTSNRYYKLMENGEFDTEPFADYDAPDVGGRTKGSEAPPSLNADEGGIPNLQDDSKMVIYDEGAPSSSGMDTTV